MIFSSSDIEGLIGKDPIIRAICSVEIVDTKPALRAGEGVVIYIKKYPDLTEFEARWDIWIIDYDNEPVDIVIRQLRALLPQFTIIEEGAIIKASTTELRSEKTERIVAPKEQITQVDPYEARFEDLLQSIEDRMLLVGPGQPGKDGLNGIAGKDGEDGEDGRDLLATDAELNDLKDVFVSDANRGQFLMFDGAGWIPRFAPQVFSGGGGSTGGGGVTMPEPPSDGRFYLRQVTDNTGQWVDLLTALNSLTLDAGDFDGRSFDTLAGEIIVTGSNSFLRIVKTFHCDSGVFIATGEPAPILFNRVLGFDSGSILLSGGNANIAIGYNLVAGPGSFSVTGLAADDVIGYRIIGNVTSFALDGMNAEIKYNEPVGGFYTTWLAQNYNYQSEFYPEGWAG